MYRKKTKGWSQHLDFMAWDMVCIVLSFFVGNALHTNWRSMIADSQFWTLCIGAALIDLLVMVIIDAYNNVIRRDSFRELRLLLKQTVYVTLVMVMFILLMNATNAELFNVLLPAIPLYILVCFCIRILWKEFLRQRLHLKNRTGMLVVSRQSRLKHLIETLVNHNYDSYRFVGAALLEEDVDIEEAQKALGTIRQGEKEIDGLQIVANRNTLMQYLMTNWVDEIYLDIPGDEKICSLFEGNMIY